MDQEEQQVQGAPDPATGDFEAVLAAAARGDYDNRAEPEAATGARQASPDPEPATEAATAPESQEVEQQASPEQAPTQEKPEDWQRKYHSVAGNNAQLQQQLRQQQAQFEQAQREFQQQQLQWQRQQELAGEEARIRASVPAELADEAVNEFRQRKEFEFQQAEYRQGAEAYRQYLLAEHNEVEEARVELFRSSVPSVMPDLARHIAQQVQAPEEGLVALAGSEAMGEVYKMVGRPPARGTTLAQRDMDLIAAVMAGFGQVEARRDAERKRGNAQAAVAAGTFRGEPDATGRGSGLSEVERIKAMDDKDFDALIARLGG